MKNKKIAFTFVELIIVVMILSILTTIWFSSYIWYISDARDSQRKSDLAQVWSALKVYKQKRGYYPLPWEIFNITYSWTTIAYQWKFNKNVRLNTLDNLPLDPKINIPYKYSIVTNKQEYEISASLENEDKILALVNSSYKSVSRNILPAISLAIDASVWDNIEIKDWLWNWSTNRNKFIFDNQNYNLPYTFIEPYNAYSSWSTIDEIITQLEVNNNYWQNTDFRNCLEIDEAWKTILPFDANPFEYQIITDTWALINTWCTL